MALDQRTALPPALQLGRVEKRQDIGFEDIHRRRRREVTGPEGAVVDEAAEAEGAGSGAAGEPHERPEEDALAKRRGELVEVPGGTLDRDVRTGGIVHPRGHSVMANGIRRSSSR